MRSVHLSVTVPAADLATAFTTIADFGRYPELVPDVVRSVAVEPAAPGAPFLSAWEVFFRNGILAWTETDVLRPEAATIEFEQTVGDFEEFSGRWVLNERSGPAGGAGPVQVGVVFTADFDFGVPSLASIVDPVAERVLVETITEILRGLFGTVRDDAGTAIPSPAAAPVPLVPSPAAGAPRPGPALSTAV
jgi:ribosome-associated toxin RatA of RatAB toxin-antitoxin module